jgi:hypothetical protein
MAATEPEARFNNGVAASVDFAYAAMEDDIRRELEKANPDASAALTRLLDRLRDRRSVLDEFKIIVAASGRAAT